MIWYKPGFSTQLAITATCFSAFLLYVQYRIFHLQYTSPVNTNVINSAVLGTIRVSSEVHKCLPEP